MDLRVDRLACIRALARIVGAIATSVALVGCASSLAHRPLHPIPDESRPAEMPQARGSERDAAMIPSSQQLEIYRELVRGFFRPTRGQARWIDPQPLSHRRERTSDSLALEDDDWADAIVRTIGLRRLCALGAQDADCRGRPGGVLRFSAPYATSAAPDAAVVFTRYSTVDAGDVAASGVRFEMEFRLARRDGTWRIVSKRTIAGPDDLR